MERYKVPFPLAANFIVYDDVDGERFCKRLGAATSFSADRIAGTITITALGEVNDIDTTAQLMLIPNQAFPPQFALFFTGRSRSQPAKRRFYAEASIHTEVHLTVIEVQDADGKHDVPVQDF